MIRISVKEIYLRWDIAEVSRFKIALYVSFYFFERMIRDILAR